jgi:hypothetical protein
MCPLIEGLTPSCANCERHQDESTEPHHRRTEAWDQCGLWSGFVTKGMHWSHPSAWDLLMNPPTQPYCIVQNERKPLPPPKAFPWDSQAMPTQSLPCFIWTLTYAKFVLFCLTILDSALGLQMAANWSKNFLQVSPYKSPTSAAWAYQRQAEQVDTFR